VRVALSLRAVTGPALLWFRRDLRLADHPALHAARDDGDGDVVGVFVLDQGLWNRAGLARRTFLAQSLADLNDRLDGRLTVLTGDPVRTIVSAARHVGAGAVHVSEEFTPYGRGRDEKVASALAEHDIGWVPTGSPYAVSPGRITKADGEPYRVFTPFSKAWAAHGWRAPAGSVRTVDWQRYDGPHRGSLPTQDADLDLPVATEAAARKAWQRFRDGDLESYTADRNRPDLDHTSRMSAYLHFGLLHPRTLLADLSERSGTGPSTYRNELCWREFYADVLHVNPGSAWETYNPIFANFRWDDDRAPFEQWQRGETGFPMVDAGMRQLLAQGWMHNRLRMITASFLVKDLHLPWQWGAQHFLDHLVDGDLASNNHGWQWTAGTGTDAAPYFRVFNPILQGKKYDPAGDFVRRWVPELRGVDGPAVHEPWALPEHPAGYAEPMVDHHAERDEALRRYEEVRG
jgi:deoxyribodipyrimidine photo-lyase